MFCNPDWDGAMAAGCGWDARDGGVPALAGCVAACAGWAHIADIGSVYTGGFSCCEKKKKNLQSHVAEHLESC